MTYRIETLGCKLNFSESATIGARLQQAGITPACDGDMPDVVVVNTCSVTSMADRKCRQQIRHLTRLYPAALVVVTGCYAQLQSREVAAIDGVDIVLGAEQKGNLVDYVLAEIKEGGKLVDVSPLRDIRTFAPSCERGERTRYWLKVQDGCDYYCSYCTIPRARGRSRSGSIASLVDQARAVADAGGLEIVITGVNIGDFGKNTGERFIDLLRALDAVDGIARYRISSLEPDLLTDEIIDFVAASRAFMPHWHLPLQSGSDTVLRLMGRHYDAALFRDRVERVRRVMPDCFIGVDVMTGCRGETPECHRESLALLRDLDVQHLHVFPYSERPGTRALAIPYIVSAADKTARARELQALSDRKEAEFAARFVGTVRPVLFEHPHGAPVMHGYTDNYIRVSRPADPSLLDRLVPVTL
ncbi:MAG: tRNA (N(6)-L-threonylcarbamoyladenosine(37)-C(2))-methylthiotransferase MtaB [Muribaculaceae bacterium]|nr:tRNA (N(6)-L-threonylcarbamoyladenosine(37)-C(2))-methylthiotransferase MtaB [Muribaculaceae bacterium]